MDHHGTMPGVVGADVFELETLRQVIVELDGPKLPFSAYDVFDYKVYFWAIEGGFADGSRYRLAVCPICNFTNYKWGTSI